MKRSKSAKQRTGGSRWSGLQARMTISYVWVTVVSVLLLEALGTLLFAVVAYPLLVTNLLEPAARQKAEQYALMASLDARDGMLNPAMTFQPSHPNSLVSPEENDPRDNIPINYIPPKDSNTQNVAFALLIAPNGEIMASSYPGRYAVGTPISLAFANHTKLVADALAGSSKSIALASPAGRLVNACAPVWSKDQKSIGAACVEIPASLPLDKLLRIWPPVGVFLVSALVVLIITAPIGGLFGVVTTRGLVRRLRTLMKATTAVADGNYDQRVAVQRNDEMGGLEEQFNRMAEQLVESINKRQELAEQNARMAERTRISRELHDAISQDLFSLRMLAGGLQTAIPEESPLYPQIMTLKQSTSTMIREMRALLLELRPTQLEHLGLAAALEDLAAAYRTRLGIEVNATIVPAQLSAQAEHTLLRIAQEALANAARHADATRITLELLPEQEQIGLTISDNGQGFEPDASETQHGVGLRAMQERVHELQGTLSVQSAPGHGTHIHVCLPRENES